MEREEGIRTGPKLSSPSAWSSPEEARACMMLSPHALSIQFLCTRYLFFFCNRNLKCLGQMCSLLSHSLQVPLAASREEDAPGKGE